MVLNQHIFNLCLLYRIGTPGTFTQGHIDSKDNFVYQIIGHKRWTIFSPQDYKFLYYTRGKGSLEWSAALNSFDASPDLKKFPLYQRATPLSFVMSPGEVLYLPRGWTHTVANPWGGPGPHPETAQSSEE